MRGMMVGGNCRLGASALRTGLGSSLSAWTPSDITTALWLDANDASTITEDAGAVSQWDDKSGNENNAVQGTGTNQPTTALSTIGGLNAIDFVTDDYLALSVAEIDMIGKGMFVVIKNRAASTSDTIMGASSANIQLRLNSTATNATIQYASDAPYYPSNPTSSDTIAKDVDSLIGFIFDTNMFFDVNGTYEDSGDTNDGSGHTLVSWIGRRAGGTPDYIDAVIGEIIVTSTILGTSDRQKLEGYLAHKWSITDRLPVDHPYKSAAPMA